MREVRVNALLYLLTTGCQWRLLPKEFPPFSTVQPVFYAAGETPGYGPDLINHSLVMRVREAAGREASAPSAEEVHRQPVGQDHRNRRSPRL